MKRITKMVIKGSSGYCSEDAAFRDKLVVERGRISYAHKPIKPCEQHPPQDWSYSSIGLEFQLLFDAACKEALALIDEPVDFCATDVGEVDLRVFFSDGSEFRKRRFAPHEAFSSLFKPLKMLVPKTESIPSVLITQDDFMDEAD